MGTRKQGKSDCYPVRADRRREAAEKFIVAEQRQTYYDLEDRTYLFARNVRGLVKILDKTIVNIEDAKQLIRSSGSIGANYIEANEAVSRKDFTHRIKICRKESKESRYWLRLIDTGTDASRESNRLSLLQEAQELMNIFGAIYRKSKE